MGKLRDRLVEPRYIAAILAAIIGIRILSAMAILVLWFPELMANPKLFSQAESLFPFIYDHQGEWRSALFAGVLSSALAIPLAVLLTRYFSDQNALAESMLIIGVGGFLVDVVATTMNFLGTLWLAQRYMADSGMQETAAFVWQWVEVWRDEGLKTISFIAIGLFTLWLARQMRGAPRSFWIQLSSWLFGAIMVLIGILDAVGLFELGEYGIASGFGHIFYALWGLSIGHWFWFRAPPRSSIGDPVG
ncbi:MAG: hypothetical protein ACE5FP_09755 [Gemmatimonadota bacterium]